ncbi:K+ channel tetramerisation domain containing protein [Plasmodium ovale wallikeri]|uniref:K+ channel tetramerisation domain containing protein n=1 Tax=Plasmodium ovale wallikeri TaxID=864142 RepID=A0A1A9A0G2_PLAOA|nr:K+ channel tetramerisation domain containing protein [Plasmodium ovale wallikeri]
MFSTYTFFPLVFVFPGNRFEYILDFLRDGVLICENDMNVLTRILIEAVYFKLFALIKIIKKKIGLLYSNMGSNVNKDIFRSIISTIEKRRKKETCKLSKLSGNASKCSELKCMNIKKKKKNYVTFVNMENTTNGLKKGDHSVKENIKGDTCKDGAYKNRENMEESNKGDNHRNDNENCLNLVPEKGKSKKISVDHVEEGKKEKIYICKEKNNKSNVNCEENEKRKTNSMLLNVHKQNKTVDYNIKNSFINDIEKMNKDAFIQNSSLIKKKKKDNLISSECMNLKNEDYKYVSFSEKNNIFFYNLESSHENEQVIGVHAEMQNGVNRNNTAGDASGAHHQNDESHADKANQAQHKNYTNYANSANYANYANCGNYASIPSEHNATYKYNNYKYNNVNNSRRDILVYSEIDDIEETSPFPIISNINLGEQIFSTTVDF